MIILASHFRMVKIMGTFPKSEGTFPKSEGTFPKCKVEFSLPSIYEGR
jgi:hypothetical protein